MAVFSCRSKLPLPAAAHPQAGIATVGLAGLLETSSQAQQGPSAWAALAGMGLVVVAEAVQALQVVTEEHYMTNLSLAPLTVVG